MITWSKLFPFISSIVFLLFHLPLSFIGYPMPILLKSATHSDQSSLKVLQSCFLALAATKVLHHTWYMHTCKRYGKYHIQISRTLLPPRKTKLYYPMYFCFGLSECLSWSSNDHDSWPHQFTTLCQAVFHCNRIYWDSDYSPKHMSMPPCITGKSCVSIWKVWTTGFRASS